MRFLRTIAIAYCLSTVAVRSFAAESSAVPDFRHEILPLLKARCVPCHGPAKTEAALNLALATGVARGGESGAAIVPGNPDDSLLWQRVAADEMPEDGPLPANEKAKLLQWIAAGAKGLPANVPAKPDGDEHWAFQKLAAQTPPDVRNANSVRTPIDRFLQKELEARALTIGPEADRHTLIRRVAIDLTGLPPTPEEIEQFVKDVSPTAYEAMVERYLASPRYGERWGKYWLDAAGYADSNGYFGADTDRPLAYRYRDYVIRSTNADKPWDQFVREQLAGDELADYQPASGVSPDKVELLEATHFLRNSPDGTDSSDGNADELRADKYAVLEGTMQIIGASMLGLTVQCAKCHDHKFEPFKQRDYYALQAVIYPAFNVEKWVKPKGRTIMAGSADEIAAWKNNNRRIDSQIERRREKFRTWLSSHRERGDVLFQDRFDEPEQKLATDWSNAAPGDEAAAGQPAVHLDSPTAPGAMIAKGELQIVESRDDGDRAFSTTKSFDWTPDEQGAWIQVTFDIVPGKYSAPYVGFFLALRDFNDAHSDAGGNVLIDGAAAGKASVYVDYPGKDSDLRGQLGTSGYEPGHNCGVRITNRGDGKFELSQVMDGVVEDGTLTLTAEDLPDGGFGFEYCCGRSFIVDNVLIEASRRETDLDPEQQKLAKLHREKREELAAEVKKLEEQKGKMPGMLAAVTDLSPEQPDVYLLERGDYKSPKDKVEAGGPAVLCTAHSPPPSKSEEKSSKHSTGRRLAFARWLTAPDSRAAALLARVTVNRMWQHHFGTGIVATPENLGYSGAPPTHPELLDYLAGEFVHSGWHSKDIHRLILNSAAYRQSSRPLEAAIKIDPDNHLLWRFPLQRLDAEAIRDGMLAVSGELETSAGGPYVPTMRDADGDVVVEEETVGAHRRSVYLQQRRTQVAGMLEVFDAPSIVFSCTYRAPTTVPLQSLKLLNSPFVRARSAALANRIEKEAGADSEARIRLAFLLTCARLPSPAELQSAQRFIAQQPKNYQASDEAELLAWTDFCQMLLSSNTFLYVD